MEENGPEELEPIGKRRELVLRFRPLSGLGIIPERHDGSFLGFQPGIHERLRTPYQSDKGLYAGAIRPRIKRLEPYIRIEQPFFLLRPFFQPQARVARKPLLRMAEVVRELLHRLIQHYNAIVILRVVHEVPAHLSVRVAETRRMSIVRIQKKAGVLYSARRRDETLRLKPEAGTVARANECAYGMRTTRCRFQLHNCCVEKQITIIFLKYFFEVRAEVFDWA